MASLFADAESPGEPHLVDSEDEGGEPVSSKHTCDEESQPQRIVRDPGLPTQQDIDEHGLADTQPTALGAKRVKRVELLELNIGVVNYKSQIYPFWHLTTCLSRLKTKLPPETSWSQAKSRHATSRF